jgi:hypothetical protein
MALAAKRPVQNTIVNGLDMVSSNAERKLAQ